MKLPAIRAKIGDWNYYITTLTFEDVAKYVSRIDNELHKSNSLKEMIQRSITENYKNIKHYIINQPEMFFNSLVLAVYDDYPDWKAIEIEYEDFKTYQMGILDFSSKHKIFPVDGQHRVEGIKAALEENPELKNQNIGAIFIGHKNDLSGMQKTRRLFSTLNRYAKPVTMDDTIALDEDDAVAIICRNLLEEHKLFSDKKITKSKNKAIQDTDKDAFTSIITLYECNKELLKTFRIKKSKEQPNPQNDKKKLPEYLKFRPSETELLEFERYCTTFWDDFVSSFDSIKTFIENHEPNPAEPYRNKKTGGNLLFRPVGLLPFISACIEINKRNGIAFNQIFEKFNGINLALNVEPWRQVLWNAYEQTMIMNNQVLTKLFLIYLFDSTLLKEKELNTLKVKYAGAINNEGNMDDILENLYSKD